MTTRRHVLEWLAAAPILSACGEHALPDPYAAWRDPGAGETDPRRFALAHAILAPNPHNTQAWQVELRGDDEMLLYCDLERRLPFTDPLDRQITIGCGCFLELYGIAARQHRYDATIAFFPDGEPSPRLDARPLAQVKLVRIESALAPGEDPLFRQIAMRRTNREVYDVTRSPSAADFGALDSVVTNTGEEYPGRFFWTADEQRVAALRDLVWRAFEREMHTTGALAETYQWLRFGREEIAEHGDGLGIEGPMMPLFKLLGLVSREAMIDPQSQSNRLALADWRKKAESAPAFLWLTSTDDSPVSRLLTGRFYARLALAAQSLGLAMHPWSQALQEYEEMADLYAEARQFLSPGGETVQMLARVGYADSVAPSARRSAEALIRPPSP
ncbi:MAG: twin-arginine translocation pathway signal protein [Hyphomonadaceae bacterium]